MQAVHCFKACDIRGRVDETLTEAISYRIGRAYAAFLQPKQVVVGGDVRLSTERLKLALVQGLMDAGVDVLDLGVVGTEEIYFATFHLGVDGGIVVTASHNPIDYNGMKLVRAGAEPISRENGLREIQALVEADQFPTLGAAERGRYQKVSVFDAYIDHLLSYVQPGNFKPLRLVVNSGNGVAGHVLDALEERFKALKIPLTLLKVHHHADGNFPNGIPNPLLPECRQDTAMAVRELGADMGIAFDGDFDRCFFFDQQGEFIDGYYIVGLLAEAFLHKEPRAKIIHDPRLLWNTIDMVRQAGGTPILSKAGHSFIKERMRQEDAVYGGEMSAHHYFRDFSYCDSGMIPWLLVAELLSVKGQSLREMVAERMAAYPISGEINRKLNDPQGTLARVLNHYHAEILETDDTDGLSLSFADWRFNLRISNTEPLLRLNVESRGDRELLEKKTAEILALLQ